MNSSPVDNLSGIAKFAIREICKDNPLIFYEVEYDDTYDKGAVFSFDSTHLLLQWHDWDFSKQKLVIIGFNPTTEDWINPSPYVTKAEKTAKYLGFGGIVLLNLFTEISADVIKLKLSKTPNFESDADNVLSKVSSAADCIVLGWGGNGKHLGRNTEVLQLLSGQKDKLFVLGWTLNKEPMHLNKTPKNSELIKYE